MSVRCLLGLLYCRYSESQLVAKKSRRLDLARACEAGVVEAANGGVNAITAWQLDEVVGLTLTVLLQREVVCCIELIKMD